MLLRSFHLLMVSDRDWNGNIFPFGLLFNDVQIEMYTQFHPFHNSLTSVAFFDSCRDEVRQPNKPPA